MRICILTTSFPLYPGMIAGSFVVEQAQHLVRLGVQVDVVAPHHAGAARHETMEGVEVHRIRYMLPEKWETLCYGAGIPTNLRKSWFARVQLPSLLLSFVFHGLRYARHCDVIQANWSLTGMAGILLGKLLRKPVVLIMYGAEIFVLKDNPLFKIPLKLILKQADHVIAISRYTQEKLIEVQRPRAVSLIPPGVDLDRFKKKLDSSRIRTILATKGIDCSKPMVFALGIFIERKGFKYLIDAVAALQERVPVQLLLGGHGPLKQDLQQQADSLGIKDKVFFLGYVPDEDLPYYYSIVDILVTPGIVDSQGDTEGLGLTLIEAMACETPCVASSVGGIVDIVQDGLNGFLVEPKDVQALADRIRLLCENPELRRKLGQQGRRFVEEHFSWQDKAREILEIHERAVN